LKKDKPIEPPKTSQPVKKLFEEPTYVKETPKSDDIMSKGSV